MNHSHIGSDFEQINSPDMQQNKPNEVSPDVISARLGEKLLQGWTMLEESCPISRACPLMQDPKTKKKWSAALNAFIEPLPASKQSGSNYSTPVACNASPPDLNHVASEEDAKKKTKTKKGKKQVKTTNTISKSEELEATEAVLLTKLAECRVFLQSLNITRKTSDESLTKLNTVAELTGTIVETLKELE
eukprot:maker-scaffold_5-snap-gene-20.8-mRNA-1 protein AED:0.06 eAED:0.06 QI:26/1/1/1/1/1/5/25/189